MKAKWRYLLILIITMVLWNTEIMKPLKIFTVFLHELGHAFMAFIFGYGITEFMVNLNESGHTLVQTKGWFSTFMIANGGYLGSLFFALLILYLKRTSMRKFILGVVAIVFLGITIKYSGFSFALVYSVLFAVMVIILYMWQNDKVNDWVIDIIGISSVAYAIYDTFVDTLLLQLNLRLQFIAGWKVTQPVTDAVQLSRLTGIPASVWGILWLIIAVLAVNGVLIKGKGSGGRKRRSASRSA